MCAPSGYVQESSAVGAKVMVQPQSLDVVRLRVDDPDWVSLSYNSTPPTLSTARWVTSG